MDGAGPRMRDSSQTPKHKGLPKEVKSKEGKKKGKNAKGVCRAQFSDQLGNNYTPTLSRGAPATLTMSPDYSGKFSRIADPV